MKGELRISRGSPEIQKIKLFVMKKTLIPIALALSLAACLLNAQDDSSKGAPPPDSPPRSDAAPRPGSERSVIRLLPPGARDRLKLTDDQVKQIDALESSARDTLAKILTPAQLQQLQRMRPPGRGGPGGGGRQGGPDARGGGGSDGMGGPGGPGGPGSDGRPPAPPPAE
jgi:Spy/CpxP family protein refolding chaperone